MSVFHFALSPLNPEVAVKNLELIDNKPVIIGRSATLGIRDKKCSKRQLEITANSDERSILVRHLGNRFSTVENHSLYKGDIISAYPGDVICVLEDKYKFKVIMCVQTGVHLSSEEKQNNQMNNTEHLCCDMLPTKNLSSEKMKKRSLELFSSNNTNIITGTKATHTNQITNYFAAKDFAKTNFTGHSSKKLKLEQDQLYQEVNSDEEEKEAERRLEQMRATLKPLKQDCSTKSVVSVTGNQMSKTMSPGWREINGKLYVYNAEALTSSSKIACFDLDGTIITTKSGKVFPTDTNDWCFLLPEIPGKIKQLTKEGYKVVFMTNQKGIAKGKIRIKDFQLKVEVIVQKLGIPIQVLVSTGSGIYRKPVTGMWQYLCECSNGSVAVNLSSSFYCGDAAGRQANWVPGKKKDFSCSDRLFALNIGIQFYTPEEFFLNQKQTAAYTLPTFNPALLKSSDQLCNPLGTKIVSFSQELILCVGYPASGKSFFVMEHLVPAGYVQVNRDMLGSWQKCVTRCRTALGQKHSVAVDNTNPDRESRNRYIQCAKEAGVPVRCFLFTASLEHSRHNNEFRHLFGTDKAHAPVNDMVINAYKSKFTEPNLDEGFASIVKINFVPRFKENELEKMYHRYILDK